MTLDTGLTPENVQLALLLYGGMFVGVLSAVLLACELHEGFCLWRARAGVRRSADYRLDP
jgi:hypothetical protein